MFDTHCHLNFQVFDGKVKEIIKEAQSVNVSQIVVPGTDIPTSEKAIKIAEKFEGVYAAVGIHPHHVFEIFNKNRSSATQIFQKTNKTEKFPFASDLQSIEKMLEHEKIVAIGEIGIDRHYYQKTKHKDYKVDEEFVDLQKEFFREQIKLAIKYDKSVIIHNREAKKDVLEILMDYGLRITDYRSVFHCCEPDPELLEFAKDHKMFIGVDGDIVYWKEKLFGFAQSKQEWIKSVPLEMLVLETDSPYLSPTRQFPNSPKNILVIAECVAKLKGVSINQLIDTTTKNAKILFRL